MVNSAVIDRDACVREIATYLGWQIIAHNITPQVEGKVPVSDLSGLHSNNNSVQYDLINPMGQMVASGLFASDLTAILPDWWNVTDLTFTLPLGSNSWVIEKFSDASDYSVQIGDIENNGIWVMNELAAIEYPKLSTAMCLAWLEYKRSGN